MNKWLPPIKEEQSDWDELEERIRKLLRRELYAPLLLQIGESRTVLNSIEDEENLALAISRGRIEFSRGQFSGSFSAATTRALKSVGAKWDAKTRTFRIPHAKLPIAIKSAISTSEVRFRAKLTALDQMLAKVLPERIAQHLRTEDIFSRTLFKTDRKLGASMKGITVQPELTKATREKIARAWGENMRLNIKSFTEEEIIKLRKQVKRAAFAGNRRDSLVGTIQKSYGVSENKAKFLARQETSLLMSTFKETRYRDAGVKSYKWCCVSGTKAHPVRPAHKALDGKIFQWDSPPVTTAPGEPVRRNNPGQDYNCRCFARPLVGFKK